MFCFKRKFVITSDGTQLQYYLKNKHGDYKKILKEILEEIEAFFIVPDGKGINDYKVIKKSEEVYSRILILTRAEYKELTSKKYLQRIINSKQVFDLR